VGVVKGVPVCDLPYPEDSTADVDMNVVMTSEGSFVEVQGTAEGAAFGRPVLDQLLDLAQQGIGQLVERQRAYVAEAPSPRPAQR
jgi:ribonuclease PH